MGNLNCFKYNDQQNKTKWFDEWQNNSSYQQPYNFYNTNYCDRMNEANFSPDQDMANYYMNNSFPNASYSRNESYPGYSSDIIDPSQYDEERNTYNMHMQQYYGGSAYGKDPNEMDENFSGNCDPNRSVQDNVQEAFMSDWFVREEAELNSNMQTLQKADKNCEYNEDVYDEDKKKKYQNKKELKLETDSSETSSDSDMCTIEYLGKPIDKMNKNESTMGFSTKKNSKCCYTAYIMCNNSVEWENFLKRSARMMTGLQRQFSCIIKFSDKISFHRGNSVRTFQIIGSHKGNVIRCKAALPKMVSKMLITSMTCSAEVEEYSKECNRESRPTINRKMKCLN